jgi:hexosaminidase
LSYSYYEGFFRSVKQMEMQQPANTGEVNAQWIPDVVNSGSFGFIFSGLLSIQQEGLYHFHLSSDDGSMMYLNGEEFINNDGLHSNQTVTEPAALKKGLYNVRIYFIEGGGGYNLGLKVNLPDGTDKVLLPGDFLIEG